MENERLPEATFNTRPRLYGIVHTYIQKQLPRDIHPAFKALRDREEAATTLPQIGAVEEATLPLPVGREHRFRVDGDYDGDGDLPLYAAFQGKILYRN